MAASTSFVTLEGKGMHRLRLFGISLVIGLACITSSKPRTARCGPSRMVNSIESSPSFDRSTARRRTSSTTCGTISHPMSFGDPIYQKIRGYDTPNLNKLAREGMIFARMCTEPGCTPSRAAMMTGQLAIRTGHYEIGFPVEYTGLAAENVTLAEVLSKAGYATGFYGKLHLGDIEESYPHNQGYDEAFWGVYNQVVSLYNKQGEAANAIIGMKEELLAKNPYQRDHKFVQDESFVFYLEGKKGELAKEWRDGSQEIQDYRDFDGESRKRALAFIRRNAEAKKPFFVSWWPFMLASSHSRRRPHFSEAWLVRTTTVWSSPTSSSFERHWRILASPRTP